MDSNLSPFYEIRFNLLKLLKDIYQRDCFNDLNPQGRLSGIVGPRGVGKTSFILNYCKKHFAVESQQALYISADNYLLNEIKLFEIAQTFINNHAGQLLCLDEIHRYKNWNQELKNIYDSFPQLQVLFSGSSALDLVSGAYDLSRRVRIKHLNGLSFREYLNLKLNTKFAAIDLAQLLKSTNEFSVHVAETPKLLGHFKEYLSYGYLPYFKEFSTLRDFYSAVMASIDKSIYVDIADIYSLNTDSLACLRKIVYFFATSEPGSLSINKISNSLGRDHKTVANYLDILHDAGLLRFLLKDATGHALVRNAEKVYLENTVNVFAIWHDLGKDAGAGMLREIFAVSQLQNAGHKICYTGYGDLKCGDYTIEIGGKNKDSHQVRNIASSYIFKDDILYPSGNFIPLYLLGFLY